MKLAVSFRPLAQREFDLAFDWYERQRAGLGRRFHNAVMDALRNIAERPEMFEIVHRNMRRCIVEDFPYSVYFRIEVDGITVLSVFHSSRNPIIWKRRQ